jgi:MFS family permease
MVKAEKGAVTSYLVAFCLFWFCLGGWLALAPATTLHFFNPDHYAQNYGIVFTAYGVGALIGTLVTGKICRLVRHLHLCFLCHGCIGNTGHFSR